MTTLLAIVLVVVLVGVIGGLILWLVSMLGLGIEVQGFGNAFLAALVISAVGNIIERLIALVWTIPGGWLGLIINLIVAAIVLMVSDKFLRGMRVNGFGGAIIGAIGISLVSFGAAWLVGFIF